MDMVGGRIEDYWDHVKCVNGWPLPTFYKSVPACNTDHADATEDPLMLPYSSPSRFPVPTLEQLERNWALEKLLKEATRRKLTAAEIELQRQSWVRSMGLKPRVRVKATGVRW